MPSGASNPDPFRASRYQVKDGTTSSGSAGQAHRDAQQRIKSLAGRNLEKGDAGRPAASKSDSPSPGSSTEGSVRRPSTPKWSNQDMDQAENSLRNYVTPKRTDQLKQVKLAVSGTLLTCGQAVADFVTNDINPPATRFEFFDLLTKTILDKECDDEVFVEFIGTFFAYIWCQGHARIPRSPEEDVPEILDVYDADTLDLRNHQIDDVFGSNGKSPKRTACERGFASQVWEITYAFMFGAGRPANFLLKKKPVDIVPDDAIRAFTPYLCRTKDEGEQGNEDGARYRDFAAGSSAAAEPDRDQAEELSSSPSRDMRRVLLDPRGGNSANETVDDVDDCLDDDGNVSRAG